MDKCAGKAMMELFVYNWFYTGHSVHGHCLDENGGYVLLNVVGFYPSCYVQGETIPASSVTPIKAEYRRMATSRDISRLTPFYRLYFEDAKRMYAFISDTRANICMADVPQIAIFLSEVGADYVGWVRVPGTVCTPNNITPLPERIQYPSPKVMAFDIEVKSTGSGMPQPHRMEDKVEMISAVVFGSKRWKHYILHTRARPMCLNDPEAEDVSYIDEVSLIRGFFELVQQEDPTVITGFNIYGFDLHYLVSRLQLRLADIPDVSRGLRNSVSLIKVDWSSDAYGHNQFDRLVIGGRLVIDMFLYFRRMKLDRYSLDFVSKEFLGEGKNDMPHSRMMEAFDSGNHEELREVARYCLQDSALVARLFEKVQMWIDVCEVSKIMRCNIEDIYTRGEQMKLISQCVKECVERGIVLQQQERMEWKSYEGAHVLEPVKGVYDGCCTLDFQSLYPSIMIAFNICPSTCCKPSSKNSHTIGDYAFLNSPIGLLPGMVKSVLDERKAVKELMKLCSKDTIEHTVLDRRQNALKICANSVYGMMGFKNSRYFGHLGCAEAVTAMGRNFLLDIVKKIEASYPVRVIYGDTDSCMLWHTDRDVSKEEMEHLGRRVCDNVTSALPEPMALKFESYYDKVVLLTKKRYILVKDGAVSYKGVMNARRDYCRYAKDTYEAVMAMVAAGESNGSITDYIDRRMLVLLSGRCDMSDMIITKSLAKELTAYKVNQPHVVFARRLVSETGNSIKAGTRLEYVHVKGDNGMVTPEDATARELQIDGGFYINKQIATQVDDVLSVMGLGNYIKDTWCSLCK
jgi:DNA polymerase delta subunit 1